MKIGKKVSLPTKYVEPDGTLDAAIVFIYGDTKRGKTTLANEGGRTLFLQCDPEQRSYRRMEYLIREWEDFRVAMRELERRQRKGSFPWTRVCLDGVDRWFVYCQAYVCYKLGIGHPQDASWGKGWSALKTEFDSGVHRLLDLRCSRWFTSHATWDEEELPNGQSSARLVPKLTGMAEEIMRAVDCRFAYDLHEGRRALYIAGSERYSAGHRLDCPEYPHFRTPEGRRLEWVYMGTDAGQAYDNLVAAYNNEYEHPVQRVKRRRKLLKARK